MTKPRSNAAMSLAQRDSMIVRAYRRRFDLTCEEIGARYGISGPRVSVIVAARGALDPERRSHASRRRWESGAFEGAKLGRKPVWPDMPEEYRREFVRLRNKGVGRAEARALLEGSG
jgi:hypothetical protein